MMKKLNITIAVILFLSFIYFLFQGSKNPVILQYSGAKIILIIFILLASAYFYATSTWKKTSEWNVALIISLAMSVVALEIFLRLFITDLPWKIVKNLPFEARGIHAASAGNFADSSLNGDGLLYFYPPYFQIKSRPNIKIDALGYRNPRDLKANSDIDLVLLGDSVTIAREVAMLILGTFLG